MEVMVSKRPSITYYPKENQVLGLQAFLDQQLHTTETHLTTPKTIIPPGMVTKVVVTQFRAKNGNYVNYVYCTVAKKQQTVLVNWGLKERWF